MLAADTIFSGYSTAVSEEVFIVQNDSLSNDSLHKKMMADTSLNADSTKKFPSPKLKNEKDSSYYLAHLIDSLNKQQHNLKEENFQKEKAAYADSLRLIHLEKDSIKTDSIKSIFKEKNIEIKDSLRLQKKDTAGISPIPKKDTTNAIRSQKRDTFLNLDSLQLQKKDTTKGADSSRYFLAFHHVRIYNDSLQSVCDSLFYSTKDSVFRLYLTTQSSGVAIRR